MLIDLAANVENMGIKVYFHHEGNIFSSRSRYTFLTRKPGFPREGDRVSLLRHRGVLRYVVISPFEEFIYL